MIDPIHLRRRVRWVLSTLPKNRRLSEEMIFDRLKDDFPGLKTGELSIAISWNHTQGFIEYRYNTDLERNEWCLSDEGWHKEGLA